MAPLLGTWFYGLREYSSRVRSTLFMQSWPESEVFVSSKVILLLFLLSPPINRQIKAYHSLSEVYLPFPLSGKFYHLYKTS